MEMDRLDFIVHELKEWKKHDPKLDDKLGFIKYYMQTNYRDLRILRTRVWLRQYDEARLRRTSVAELLFDKMKMMYVLSNQGPSSMPEGSIDITRAQRVLQLREIYESRYRDILEKNG